MSTEYLMARRVLMAEVSGGRVQSRPRLGCMRCEDSFWQPMDFGEGCSTIL